LIKNDALRDQAQAFIRQEGHHAHAHHRLNDFLEQKSGMPEVLEGMKAFWLSSKAKALAYRPGLQGALLFIVYGESLTAAIGDYLFRTWKALAYRPGLQGALLFIVYGESLTAAIGDYLFRTWSERLDAWDPNAAYIMFYHAVEEIEHKGLSYTHGK
jgi:predicted metal-dependent hydrolase